MPKFEHDCAVCTYLATGEFNGRECDFYVCCDSRGDRSFVARYGSDGAQYSSVGLFECIELTTLDTFALLHGLELTADEERRLLRLLLNTHKAELTRDKRKIMGNNPNDLLGKAKHFSDPIRWR